VDELDALYAQFGAAGLPADRTPIPRLTPQENIGNGLRMFAFIDRDGSLWRCIQGETRNEL